MVGLTSPFFELPSFLVPSVHRPRSLYNDSRSKLMVLGPNSNMKPPDAAPEISKPRHETRPQETPGELRRCQETPKETPNLSWLVQIPSITNPKRRKRLVESRTTNRSHVFSTLNQGSKMGGILQCRRHRLNQECYHPVNCSCYAWRDRIDRQTDGQTDGQPGSS